MATTIALQPETKEALRRMGEKGETYDQIVRRLIEVEVSAELDAKWNKILEEDDWVPLDEFPDA